MSWLWLLILLPIGFLIGVLIIGDSLWKWLSDLHWRFLGYRAEKRRQRVLSEKFIEDMVDTLDDMANYARFRAKGRPTKEAWSAADALAAAARNLHSARIWLIRDQAHNERTHTS